MKKEIKKTKLKPRKKAEVKRDQYTVVLEDVRRQFGVMSEGFSGMHRRFDKLDKKVDSNHKEFLEFRGVMIGFKNEMTDFKSEMIDFKDEMTDFKSETNSNFKAVFEYLSKIDDEIQSIELDIADLKNVLKNKADLDRITQIEKELVIIKRELVYCRKQ